MADVFIWRRRRDDPAAAVPCVIRPCSIAAADFAAKNVPPAHFFNAAHPLRLQIPPIFHAKQKTTPKGGFLFGAEGGI